MILKPDYYIKQKEKQMNKSEQEKIIDLHKEHEKLKSKYHLAMYFIKRYIQKDNELFLELIDKYGEEENDV
jgi:hypothetical protein